MNRKIVDDRHVKDRNRRSKEEVDMIVRGDSSLIREREMDEQT